MEANEGKATGRPWRVGDAGATVFGPPRHGLPPIMVAQRTLGCDAALIGAAVNERDGLLAEVARLREENADFETDCEALEVEVARLRAALAGTVAWLEAIGPTDAAINAQPDGFGLNAARAALAGKGGAA